MTNAYTESKLVEEPAAELFALLGWDVVNATEEEFGPTGTLGRASKAEVVLLPRLRAALKKLNPQLPADAIESAVEQLTRDRSAMPPAAANRELYTLLKERIEVTVPDTERGGQKTERVRVIDWEHPEHNEFLVVRQFKVQAPLYACIPDMVGFVNGLPLVVMEFKKPSVPARQAFDDNLTSYKHAQNGIPSLFWYNALLIASNGTDSRVGSITADWDRFFNWKRIAREDEPRRVSLEVILRGTCEKSRLLDLVENFTLFSKDKSGLVKILGQNHQFLGVNNAIRASLTARSEGHGRGGVFWQTQGSGKSFSMVFYAQKVMRKVPGDWTFVVVTDRVELDDQIAKTFGACGAVADAAQAHAGSAAHLRRLLGENHRYVFTLIHKFKTAEVLCDRRDVIVLVDEAHRSQYDTLAMNMRAAMPNALFVAFTGTPLLAGEQRTREVFGDYVSIYDFKQSVEDNATVPLYYENRTPELQLVNPDLNDDIYDVIEAAGLDDAQEEQLDRVLGKQYHLITRDDRLDTVAKDIVSHFLGRGFQGKAMVVSIDKATALRMHDKVRKAWAAEKVRVEKALADYDAPAVTRAELKERLERINTADMAVIVSAGQNEIEQMKKLGLDIVGHRKRMVESQPPLDEKFKDPKDPLSLVFVCAMWLTGFDAPSCSTVYLDKPMRNHTLMQTIARANRVYPGKQSGMIVDYANVFTSLEKALALYGTGQPGEKPVQDKSELVAALREALKLVTEFCAVHAVDLDGIEAHPVGSVARLTAWGLAVDRLIAPDERRKDFMGQARFAERLYRAVKPSPAAAEFSVRVSTVAELANTIFRTLNPEAPDISEVMGQIGVVLDASVAGVGIPDRAYRPINLSEIDFETLAARFKKSDTKNTDLEALKAAIRARLERMVSANRTRLDFKERFEELIEAYNTGSKTIEQVLDELLALSNTLDDEQARHVREALTEEELVIFDILTRPGPELDTAERAEVKKVARTLLERIRALVSINWRQTTQARARVKDAIEETLDTGLPEKYTRQLFSAKAGALFEHVNEKFGEVG